MKKNSCIFGFSANFHKMWSGRIFEKKQPIEIKEFINLIKQEINVCTFVGIWNLDQREKKNV